MTYVGIDIGAKGAMAIIRDSNNIDIFDYNIIKYQAVLKNISNPYILIEKIHSMPKQGVVSMFNFGVKYGEIKTMMLLLGLEYTEISPRRWQQAIGVVSGSGKKGIYEKIISIYPHIKNQLVGSRGGIKDGRCDALAIAHYATIRKLNEITKLSTKSS